MCVWAWCFQAWRPRAWPQGHGIIILPIFFSFAGYGSSLCAFKHGGLGHGLKGMAAFGMAYSFAIRLGDWPLTVGFSVWCFEVMVLRCLADIVLAGRRWRGLIWCREWLSIFAKASCTSFISSGFLLGVYSWLFINQAIHIELIISGALFS